MEVYCKGVRLIAWRGEVGMSVREGQEKATGHVLAHVERARDSLRNIRGDNVSADGVFIHPQMQLLALKVAREELNKAIALMERTKWTRT
jgi:hypothetical protein